MLSNCVQLKSNQMYQMRFPMLSFAASNVASEHYSSSNALATHTHIPDPPQCLKIPSFRYAEKFQQKKMERKKDYMKSRSRPLTLHGRYAFVPICAVTFVIP